MGTVGVRPGLEQPPFEGSLRLYTSAGDDMTWRLYPATGGSDYIRDQRHQRLLQNTQGNMLRSVISGYRPPLLVTDLMRAPALPGRPVFQRFHGKARDTDTSEVYYREGSFLISAGGRHDESEGLADWLSWLFSGLADDHGIAISTTLMPTAEVGDC